MNLKRLIYSISLICFIPLMLNAQMAMGSWKTHISYSGINQIIQSNDKVFGLSSGSLFSVNKSDAFVETYSKTSGLNDNNIHLIAYLDHTNTLLIAYNNSNIDLITDEGEIINVPDIYRKSMSGSKKINDISCVDNVAYIACDFGITILDVNKQEFLETAIIGDQGKSERIINIAIDADNSIYALTPNNILVGNTNDNLLNYQNWGKLSNPNPKQENLKMMLTNNTIYLLKSDYTLFKYINNEWQQYKTNIKNISYSHDVIFLTDTTNVLTKIEDNESEFIAENAVDGLYDKTNNNIWYIADGILYQKRLADNIINRFLPNGPLSNTSWRLKYSNGRIFSIPGGRWDVNYYTPGSLSFYENGIWRTYNNGYFASQTPTTYRCYDLVDIAINPDDKTNYWIASYGLGLYEFRNDEIYKFHHCDNSGIESIFPNGDKYNYTRTDGMTYDHLGNLWILNNAGSLIKYIDPSGVYHDVPNSTIVSHNYLTSQDILISNQNPNHKIILLPRYRGTNNSILYALDDNGTLNNTYDDRTVALTKVYDQDNKELSFSATPLLRSIAQDKNGVIWVGTTEGIFLINNPEKMFDTNFRVHRIKIPRTDGSGLADYLLGTEEIKAIAVDGANRKWIGTTSSGIYLVSEDGLETIHHFTAENSPLLSNAIQSIAINDQTGEVFIGTGNGLISYQSDAIEGGKKFENVRAYPNPVRPEYAGVITITGLTFDTRVTITDANGNLIHETRSNGGVALWDGCNHSGQRVASGVYFAHCVSENGKQKHIAKILVIK